ncbi:unnamed protein product [Cyprideis torosa]|uniref:Uncharacterized protein n=1 Tax=Cyprideis torosa TaxID=163714 RepID=A0A7R8ZH47_9CRUS|nr:unnamed protein product [Cyprideis torosa]CAG0882843.1 unnamed protein product [Cyprideis torosa]
MEFFMFTMTAVGSVPRSLSASTSAESWSKVLFPASTQVLTLQTLLIFLCAILITKTIQKQLLFAKLPPGPKGVPILGFVPYLTKNIHHQLNNLKNQFGSTYKLYFGSQLVVVLTDPKTIRNALKQDAFSSRPENHLIKTFLEGYGVVNANGELWKGQRRFLHMKLRQFGMKQMGSGRGQLEQKITAEVHNMIGSLASARNESTLDELLSAAISNVISSVTMSVRFDPSNADFKRFHANIEEGFRLFGLVAQVGIFPILRYLPSVTSTYEKIRQNKEEMHDFFRTIIKQHKESFDPEVTRDIVDAYLLEIYKAQQEGREAVLFNGKDPERQLCQIMGDLYSAGMETIKTTILWALIYMLHHTEVADKVREEMDEVVGRDRLPNLEDLPQLCYTEATIMEVLRMANTVGLGVIHSADRDTELDGFLIPKDTQIIPLSYAVHMSEEHWNNPQEFNPERFINEEGRVVKPEAFMPFGSGRRMCLGEVMARHEVFLLFTSLLHCFHFELPPGKSLPSLEPHHIGATICPEKFEINFVPRDELSQSLPEVETEVEVTR